MNDKKLKKPIITFPYRGVRRSYFVYHPAYNGAKDKPGQWEATAERFLTMLEGFCDVCELYGDQQTHSETVGGPKWKREIMSLFRAIEKETKEVYELEALAEQIFDVEDRTKQRVLPYHSELKTRSTTIRLEDLGMTTGKGLVDPKGIVQRGWAS